MIKNLILIGACAKVQQELLRLLELVELVELESEEDEKAEKEFKKLNMAHFKEYCRLISQNGRLIKKNLFITKTVFDDICESVDRNVKRPNAKMKSYEKVVIFLLFVTGKSSYSALARQTGTSKSTISGICNNIATFINKDMVSISMPKTPEEWIEVENTFVRRKLMRNLGCLDGKHVEIKAPPSSGTLFYNYKGFFSFVLLALVDGDGRFVFIHVGSPGSSNDAMIFNSSILKETLEEGSTLPQPSLWDATTTMPPFIIGDGIFPMGPDETIFKARTHSSGREVQQDVVEHARQSRARVRMSGVKISIAPRRA